MARDRRDRPNDLPWPPIIYAAAILVAWVLESYDRFVWLDLNLSTLPLEAGLVLIGIGLLIDIWAMIVLWRARTTILPNAPPSALVTRGPYRFSRNPIYVGNTIALAGLGLALRWGWLLLLLPVTVTAVSWLAVSREETFLERKFGEEWRSYARRVRRWI
jgi:protein-S-isoprenylcysteine O-methyltransferase Ste14